MKRIIEKCSFVSKYEIRVRPPVIKPKKDVAL